MTALRRRMLEELQPRNYSSETIRAYLVAVRGSRLTSHDEDARRLLTCQWPYCIIAFSIDSDKITATFCGVCMHTSARPLLRVAPLERLLNLPPLSVLVSLAIVAAILGSGAYVLLF